MKLCRSVFCLSIFTIMFGFSNIVSAAPNGQKLYIQHCSACHNTNGIGGIGLPLNTQKMSDLPKSYLFKTIRNGRKGRIMPAFETLSDIQIESIVAVLQGWAHGKNSTSYSQKRIIADPVNGAKLFQQQCASCHGENGQSTDNGTGVSISRERGFKVIPPALNNVGFLASASDEWIKHTIKIGRPGTIMPPHEDLKDSELNDLTHFIRDFSKHPEVVEELEYEEPTLVFESPYDFKTTVNNLRESLLGLNFAGFPDRYMEMGLAAENVINKKQLSMRFCNFNQLYKFINTDPRLGIFLPCRLTISEGDDGKVTIYMINLPKAARLFNNDQLTNGLRDVQETIIEVIEEATI